MNISNVSNYSKHNIVDISVLKKSLENLRCAMSIFIFFLQNVEASFVFLLQISEK